ncbi:DLW-39 family protein [Arthrobacter sp. NEB 688]|nr:DLW-39 family protein [Arthrobacter sp. NEB 688]
MKKFLVLLASAAGAFALNKQIKGKQAENRLWAEATDTPQG